jgi:Na+-driven multidrug efflux pump
VFFQSIGKGNIASFLLIARQVILFVPIVIILPFFMGLNGVWTAVPISDALIVIISSILVIRELRRLGISKAGSIERQQA